MHSSLFFFFPVFLTFFQHFNVCSADDYLHYICGSTGKEAEDSAYRYNLAKLFAALSNEVAASEGFATNVTDVPYRFYGLVLCRGDVSSAVCGNCLNRSVAEIQAVCKSSEEATIWYDFCFLRYSNNNFLGSTDNSQEVILWNSENVTTEKFSGWSSSNTVAESYLRAMMEALLSGVAYRAAYNSENMFAVGDMNVTSSGPMIYSMSQCTPDMTNDTCHTCLNDLIGKMINDFDGREGGRILGVQCSLRYEVYDFFSEHQGLLPINSISGPVQQNEPDAEAGNRPTPAPTPSTTPQSHNSTTPAPAPSLVPTRTSKAGDPGGSSTFFSGETRKVFIIIINVIAAVLLLGCIVGFYWLKKCRYAGMDISPKSSLRSINEAPSIWARDRSSDFTFFDFHQIVKATENFSLGRKLGQGGFGTVYKGVLEDGLEVAVKRLSAQSFQGIVEFENEIQLIAKLQHTNLVRLVGWCNHDEEKLLVYECMPNKSLDTFIFDKRRGALLNWEKRYQIIEGIAQGLLYLHKHSRLRIVHRDLKASNILLDSEMVPKISDFGLARIFDPKELQTSTNRVVGTYGYMAPEYASEGLFSVKSDVYSFGVLLLEIISGKRNMGFRQYGEFLNLIGYAWDRWREGQISELISPCLSEASMKQIERCIHVALLCVQENPIDRPIISNVITFLSTENIILPEPKQPAYFNIRITENVFESSYFYGSSRSINYITMSGPEGR